MIKILVLAVAAGVAVIVAPEYLLFPMGQVCAMLAAAAGLTLLMGQSGQISLGHAGLMAVGGYAMAFTQNALYDAGFSATRPAGGSGRFAAVAQPTSAPWTLLVALLAGVLAATAVGLLVGFAAARLRGPYLAGVTLAVGLLVLPVSAIFDGLGGEQGFSVQVPAVSAGADARWRTGVALFGVVIVLVLLQRLVRGRFGRTLRAVRDNEVAAALAGVAVSRARVLAFAVSAAPAGLAGALIVTLTGNVLPGYFTVTTSLYLVAAVVIGGLGSLAGAAWGVLFVVGVPRVVADVLDDVHAGPAVTARISGNLPLVLFGLALVAVTLTAPGGLQAVLRRERRNR